ncbi:MAG: flagellar basal body rod protein FlgC [Hyphomicrobiales bacterium]|jgi:flagellar basal-body rod protein FlgC|nr:flagellar basal body rod protein FlgC [Hyphomicrobiales bacterium]MBZ0260970.1 flagellar basal body rod protein FlgC [Hyphomicrobiales bacterium]MCC7480688.1 flagellar basal body rod protein FlgC [Hyphomicrobiales bacterium]
MGDPLIAAMKISASGLEAQSMRVRVISENLANAQSTGSTPGSDPFRRKTISFGDELDRVSGATLVGVQGVQTDQSPFPLEFDPGNPAANAAGYVKMPNVNLILEMADMREANRSYESNLQVVKQAREMISMTIDLLRGGN